MDDPHPLLVAARKATTDPDAQVYVQGVIARLEAVLGEAMACSDPEQARILLPAALRALYEETGVLLGRSLLSSWGWIDQQHRQLFQRARQLFGAEAAHVVQAPYHEPYVPAKSMWR